MTLRRAVTPRDGPEAAVFVAGVSSLGLEILAGRIVAPAFGSSIYVWGSIIGVFLAALALGYHRGGERAAERASTGAIVTILLVSALYVAGLLALAGVVIEIADAFSVPPRLSPLLPIALLFGPPVYLLGLISPYAAELSGADSAGGASGRIYAVGTAGSIVGAFGTTFLLIPRVDLPVAELGFGLLLVATAVALALRRGEDRAGRSGSNERGSATGRGLTGVRGDRERRRLLLRGLLVTIVLGAGFAVHDAGLVLTGDVVVQTETPYQGLTVVDREARELGDDRTVRTLYLEGTPQSATYLRDGRPVDDEYVFDYARYFHLAMVMSDDVDRVLFVGGGGFSGPKRFAEEYPNVTVDVVELDPVVIDVAREHFGVEESEQLNVYEGDGREFLERTNRTYDAIVLDAYRKDRVPFHLATAEFMALAESRLDEDGVLVANVISAADGPGSQFYRA
ncbi:MAG TPA: fused MFS/spermidine synthase, partial [Halobacteriales archaeon]|nr:fused MFS/spermidine synthase [Halobacteriales archaeon]